MANIKDGLTEVFKVEFSNNPDLFLHKNHGEYGYTLGGIYQKANPTQIDWDLVSWAVEKVGIKRASRMLYFDIASMESVVEVYKNSYWDGLKLDNVVSQKIANEIFLMGVVSGVKNSSKIAQRLIGVTDDGIIGNMTINALNAFNENEFDKKFDEKEIEYFESLARNNPKYERFLNGWKNRAMAV